MRLLLHIGTDKTGTTAIQQHLYLNRAWLDDKGLYLPQQGLGTNNGHAALFEAENAEGMRALSDELMAAERRGYRQAVLSWEGLSLYGRRRIKQLRTALPVGQRVVLVYLREQADIVQSGYLQQLKTLSHRLPLSADAVDDIRNHYRRSNQLLTQHYLNEFIRSVEVQKDCWSQLGPGELAKRTNQREAIIASIAEIPVHNGPLLSGAGIAAGVALLSGWQAGESWGWWSEGESSQLRLRIPFQQLLPMHVGIRLYIKGRYYGDNQKSHVVVNSLTHGEHHLSHQHAGLYVKIADLLPQQLLEIELTHEQPVSPRQFEQAVDDRQLAFGIESIGYDLVPLNKTTEEET